MCEVVKMSDNEATVESLDLLQIRIVKEDEVIRAIVDFEMGVVINAHLTTFPKNVMLDLPTNLQADIENLWDDVYEYLHDNHFDLNLL